MEGLPGESGKQKPPAPTVPPAPKVKAGAADKGRFEIQASAYREKIQAERLGRN